MQVIYKLFLTRHKNLSLRINTLQEANLLAVEFTNPHVAISIEPYGSNYILRANLLYIEAYKIEYSAIVFNTEPCDKE